MRQVDAHPRLRTRPDATDEKLGVQMPGLSELALGAAPIAGGALFGIAAGNVKSPDVRAAITKDMDLLDRLPEEQTERRERLQQSIDHRIDALITANRRGEALREAAASYSGNWRDIVLFVCALLFTFVWWNVSHDRPNWMLMFILMISLSTLAGVFAVRGVTRMLRQVFRDLRAK